MWMKRMLALLCLLLTSLPAGAQDLIVPNNTEVPFFFVENKKGSQLKEGDQIPIIVTQDVRVRDQNTESLIFKKDQKGYAEVLWASAPRHYATPGGLCIRYVYVPDVSGHEQKLFFHLKRQEKRNPFTVIVPLIAVPLVWMFKGNDASLFDAKKPDSNHYQAKVMQPFVANVPGSEKQIPSGTQNTSDPMTAFAPMPSMPVSPERALQVEGVRLASQVTTRVRQNWQPPYVKGTFAGKVTYVIDPQGQLAQVELQESTGNKTLDNSMVQAVQKTAPFPETVEYIQKNQKPNIKLIQSFSYSLE